MNVLFVDDIGFSRYRFTQALMAAGHAAQAAANGQEALAILTKDTLIDVVVTDDAMPDMDGIDLFRRSRELERLDDSGRSLMPHFILMTMPPSNSSAARVSRPVAQNALDLGFAAVLVKPVSVAALIGELQKVRKARAEGGPCTEAISSVAPTSGDGSAAAPEPPARVGSPTSDLRVDVAGPAAAPETDDSCEHREVVLEMRRLAEKLLASMPKRVPATAGPA